MLLELLLRAALLLQVLESPLLTAAEEGGSGGRQEQEKDGSKSLVAVERRAEMKMDFPETPLLKAGALPLPRDREGTFYNTCSM